jgi:putative FmdB family regulatory protein
MALYEFFCDCCKAKFEQITSSTDPERGKCPKCNGKNTRKLVSLFAVGGRGDLRESTMHGCHDWDGLGGDHDHDHDHDHADHAGESTGGEGGTEDAS